jgi:phospholipase C
MRAGARRSYRALAALVALAALSTVPMSSGVCLAAPLEPSPVERAFDNIVVIIEQDHSYDSYFGSYTSPGDGADRAPTPTPGLFALADNYVLFDNYFASSSGGTLGNMLDLLTGSDHDLLNSSKRSLSALADLDVPTVFDRLNDKGVDWRLYVGDFADVDPDKVLGGEYLADDVGVPASIYRAPILGMRRTWTDESLVARITDQEAFFNDATAGSLPPVSFVLPSPSDHPSQGAASGETRLLSLVNAVSKSPQWSRTAVFVTWDDGGAQFDSAVPPIGSGLRVPLLLVSAHAKAGFVAKTQHDHLSLLALIEHRFGLEPLTGRADPAEALAEAFGSLDVTRAPMVFSRSSLPPTPVGTSVQNAQTVLLYALGLTLAIVLVLASQLHLRKRARHADLSS